jgi:protein TonB
MVNLVSLGESGMAPILKESELGGTATDTLAPSPIAGTIEPPPKVQPVALEVTVTVNGARAIPGSDKREPFSEVTKTVLVLGNGAVIRLSSPVSPGQLLFLTNERTKKEVVCQVVKSKNYRNVSGYVELEFTEVVVGFWGMRFPGDRIGSGGTPSAAAPPAYNSVQAQPPARPAASQPAVQRAESHVQRVQPPAPPVAAPLPVASVQVAPPAVKEVAPRPKIETQPAQQKVSQAALPVESSVEANELEEFLALPVPQVLPVVPPAPVPPVTKVSAPAPVKQELVQAAPQPTISVDPVEPEIPVLTAKTSAPSLTASAQGQAAAFDPEVPVLEPFLTPEPVAPATAPQVSIPQSKAVPAPPPPAENPAPPAQNVATPPVVTEARPKQSIPPAPKAVVAHDPETEALMQQAARLQEQLSSLLFTDAPPATATSAPVSSAPGKPVSAAPNQIGQPQAPAKSKSSHVPYSTKEVDLAELLELGSTPTVAIPESAPPIRAEEIPAPVPPTVAPESGESISLEELSALGSALNAIPVEAAEVPDPELNALPEAPVLEEQPAPAKISSSLNIDDLLESVPETTTVSGPELEPKAASPTETTTASDPIPAPPKIEAKLEAPPATAAKPATPAPVKAVEKASQSPKQPPIPRIPPKPVKTSLDDTALQVPSWLEPLARNTSAPASTQELVEREKAKRVVQPPRPAEVSKPAVSTSKPKKVPGWAAPLPAGESKAAAPTAPAGKKEEKPPIDADSLFEDKPTVPTPAPAHVEHHEEPVSFPTPTFGAELHISASEYHGESESEGSRKGLMIAIIAAVVALIVGGAWWYLRQKPATPQVGIVTTPASSALVNSTTQPSTASQNSSISPLTSATPSQLDSPATRGSAEPAVSRPQRMIQPVSNPPNNTIAATSPEPVPARKPEINQGHLATPIISQKSSASTASGADPNLAFADAQPIASGTLGSSLGMANSQPAAPAVPSAPVAVGGDVKAAKLITSVSPAYPPLAKTQHISGDVKVDALIDERGRVTTMKVIAGPTLLQQAAMEALKLWKYQPATLDGKPVPMHLTVTLQFRLQ